MRETMQDRINTLESISALKVTCSIQRGQHCYQFFWNDGTVKIVFTYPKAKLYAEGVALGRTLAKVEAQNG